MHHANLQDDAHRNPGSTRVAQSQYRSVLSEHLCTYGDAALMGVVGEIREVQLVPSFSGHLILHLGRYDGYATLPQGDIALLGLFAAFIAVKLFATLFPGRYQIYITPTTQMWSPGSRIAGRSTPLRVYTSGCHRAADVFYNSLCEVSTARRYKTVNNDRPHLVRASSPFSNTFSRKPTRELELTVALFAVQLALEPSIFFGTTVSSYL